MSILIVSPQPEATPLLQRLADSLKPRLYAIYVYFSTADGAETFSLQQNVETIFSLDDLSEPPTLIVGQTHLDMMSALTRFPQTPGVYCYRDSGWISEPPITPQIGLYIATNADDYQRLRYDYGIAEERLLYVLLADFEHLPQFPLPKPKPERALVTSSEPTNQPILDTVRQVCSGMGIEVDVLSLSMITPELIETLENYDIVFACDEVAAVSVALSRVVILWHPYGAAKLITPDNLSTTLQANFRVATNYDAQTSPEALGYELAQYNLVNNENMARQVRQYYGEQAVGARISARLEKVEALAIEPTAKHHSRYLHWLAGSMPLQIAADERRSNADAIRWRALYEQTLTEKHLLEQQTAGTLASVQSMTRQPTTYERLRRIKRSILPTGSPQERLYLKIRTLARR